MRLLTLIALFFALPAFAADYCSCYQVDIEDPYARPPALMDWLDTNPDTLWSQYYKYDCFWVTSGGQGDQKNCIPGCNANGVSYVDVSTWSSGWQQLITGGSCKMPDYTSQGDNSTPCATTDCTQNNNNGGTGGTGSTTQINVTLPCGYPGAQYIDCNVYDAKVHGEVKTLVTKSDEIKTAVVEVKKSVDEVKKSVDALANGVAGVQKSVDANTAKLEEVINAAIHKGIKLTIGSCVEPDPVTEKLPKLEADIFSDKVLKGFTCAGDDVLCGQIKLQAQSYCRDVISQRLQAMYLNGANVFVKCQDGYTGQIALDGKPVCHYKTTPCLAAGQPQPIGQSLPMCDLPVVVKCPSDEFIPVVIEGGFSCDTKLNAGKFNAQMSVFQNIYKALQLRDPVGDELLSTVKDPLIKGSEGFATQLNTFHDAFKGDKVDYAKLGVNTNPTEGVSNASELFSPDKGVNISLLGYKFENPLTLSARKAYQLLVAFVPSPVLIFTSNRSCSVLTEKFAQAESSLMSILPSGSSSSNGFFAKVENSICNTYLPVARYFLGFYFAYWTALYVFNTLVASMYITFGGSGGQIVSPVATSTDCVSYKVNLG